MPVTCQAQRLIDALLRVGLRRRQFSVRTATRIIGGVRHYGNAYMITARPEVVDVVEERAADLRRSGVRVDIHPIPSTGGTIVHLSA